MDKDRQPAAANEQWNKAEGEYYERAVASQLPHEQARVASSRTSCMSRGAGVWLRVAARLSRAASIAQDPRRDIARGLSMFTMTRAHLSRLF